MTKHLKTVEEVIDELGGLKAVAALTGRTGSPSVVWNWKDRQRFPATTFVTLQTALQTRGLSAPHDLWRMS
jgi:hypothetical protein